MKEINFVQIIRLLSLLAANFGYVGCSHAPMQSTLSAHISAIPESETKPAIAELQPSVDELLTQIAPSEYCLNMLKNIRFALDTELFNRPEFHTEENMRRFFGQWYYQEKGMYKNPDLRVDGEYDRSSNRKYPWVPCFGMINIHGMYKSPSGKYTDNIKDGIFFIGKPYRWSRLPEHHNNIQFDDFLASFAPMRLEFVRDCGRALSSSEIHLVREKRFIKETIDRLQKDMVPHVYGECILTYRFNTDHFDVYITIYTYRDGSIAQLEIQTQKRGK